MVPQKHRRWFFAIVMGVAVTAVTVVLLPLLRSKHGGPSYQGRALADWLAVYAAADDTEPEFQHAIDAVRHMGTNGLPYLIERLSYEPSGNWRTKLLRPIPRSLRVRYRAILWPLVYKDSRRIAAEQAQTAFEILGQEAEPAIPALTKLLAHCKSWEATLRAVTALSHIGTNGLALVASVMTNTSNPDSLRFCALDRIQDLGANASCAVPALVGILEDPILGPQATIALSKLKLEPELVVPALARCLSSHELLLPESAADALAEFGTNALSAVPELLSATSNADEDVRIAATNALRAIAPQALVPKAN